MAQIEPMEIDSIGGVFDDKENSLQNSNVLPKTPSTEKGYEELDVSELNMKLRYSITPASSPMSKSYTANCKDNKTFNMDEDSLNSTIVNNNTSLTRSLNSTITKCDISKSSKLPLQSLPTDQLHQSLDNDHDITITVNGTFSVDENLSIPSMSSSTAHTPEATTPTKDIPKDGGSPIMRGLKSVLNMFRTSQSPIPPEEGTPKKETLESEDEEKSHLVLASTPKVSNKSNENNSLKRTSPLKDSVVFNDGLEKELQWKDDSTIIFKHEKIPIHKLLLHPSISLALEKRLQSGKENLNSTVEYMDISYNDSVLGDKTMTDVSNVNPNIECTSGVESEGEFLDCETNYTKNEVLEQHLGILDNRSNNTNSLKQLHEQSDIQVNEQITANATEINENLPKHELIVKQCQISSSNIVEHVDDKSDSHISEQIFADVTNMDDNLAQNELSNELDQKQDFDNSLNEIKNNNKLIEETTTTLALIPVDSEIRADINLVNMNVTKEINMEDSIDNELSISSKSDIKSILLQNSILNDETRVLNNTEEDQLSTTLPCGINEEIDLLEDKPLNVTLPLNIVTDYQMSNLNENTDNINIYSNEKDNNLQQENNNQILNSGILQICTSESENYIDSTSNNGHEHVNNLVVKATTDIKSTSLVLEEVSINKDANVERLAEEQVFSEQLQNVIISSVTNVEEKNNMSIEETKTESFDNPIHHDIEELVDKLDTSRVNNKYIAEDINNLNTSSTIVKEENVISEAQVQNISVLNSLPGVFPADVPLPIDKDTEEEIEKQSIKDLTICDISDANRRDIDIMTYASGDKTIDLLDAMNELCEKTVVKDIDILNETTAVTKPSDFDDVPITEFMTNTVNLQNYQFINEKKLSQNSNVISKNMLETFDKSSTLTNETVQESSIVIPENESEEFLTEGSNINVMNFDLQNIDELNKENNAKDSKHIEVENNVVSIENIDDEIITSASNSPFVSVNDLNLPKDNIDLDQAESPFETKCKIAMSPPISPKLIRKGYNINFDDIDDPFATKTNIRLSPTPELNLKRLDENVEVTLKQTEIQKKTQQNRRKSQPVRQKKPDLTKKRFNSSYNYGTKPDCKEQINILAENNPKEEQKLHDDNKDIEIHCVLTPSVSESSNLNPLEINKCETDVLDVTNKKTHISDETKNQEAEITDAVDINSSLHKSNSSDKTFLAKNVFNIPEIDDMNFNPFVTKSKMRMSPSPTFEKEIKNEIDRTPNSVTDVEITPLSSNIQSNTNNDQDNDKVETSILSNETCSSKATDKESTVREVHTEDEDTAEGPFLESEDFSDIVKVTDFGTETDLMQFEELRTEIENGNKEDGELFIDAEAFEFLLNQNKSNVVADSGKESLFLKFDPLFAKRVSSDGVLAALNRIQKRQSTPKRPSASVPKNVIDEEKPATSSNTGPLMEDNNDETNSTSTKPMMVVNPAINSLVSPRKSTTPPRINRRSLTFTSPAIAVIDRLLSLSGNSSTLDHETTIPRQNREYNETDIALTQLRELLAEKEIHVHNLRCESKELKDRLATMESQMKTLEKESEDRLRKVNDLNDRLTEKTKINKSMAVVVEEYERTIASLISDMEQEKIRNAKERSKLVSERDEQTAHLASMEVSFNDLHSKYEKSKQIILGMKANEDTYKKSLKEFEDNLIKMQNNYELLKQHATSKLNHANQELEKFNRAHDSEVLKMNAMIKRKELHITSLEESLAQKTKANEELTAICDELINKVG